MINVLYLLNYAGKAGTERYVQLLIQRLQGERIKPFFAYNKEGLLVGRLKAMGIETFRIKMRNPFDILAAWKLAQLCKKLEIDIIHTQYLRENYISILSKLFNPGVKVVWTNHFILSNSQVLKICNRLLTGFQSGIIAVCNKGKKMMIANGNDKEKIRVIFNGVDPGFWGEAEESTVREEFNIADNTTILLCGSRFAYDKGHSFLINSIYELKKIASKEFVLILANDGPMLEQCRKQAKKMGLDDKIIFAGFRSDIKNLYFGADIYINSSQHEALSMAIIEVLAAGLPVVATDMGGNSDIINDNTKCGVLVEYNNCKKMAEAINTIMENENLQKKLSSNALKTVRKIFNLDKTVKETYNLYKECSSKN